MNQMLFEQLPLVAELTRADIPGAYYYVSQERGQYLLFRSQDQISLLLGVIRVGADGSVHWRPDPAVRYLDIIPALRRYEER